MGKGNRRWSRPEPVCVLFGGSNDSDEVVIDIDRKGQRRIRVTMDAIEFFRGMCTSRGRPAMLEEMTEADNA